MISRTARTLTAVSALVLGFGPAMVQAADANNTPYAKYLDCSSSQGRTTAGGNAGCVERGEVLNFGQLRDIIAAAMYRDEVERRNSLLPDSDSRDRPDYSYTDGSTTRPPGRNTLTPDGSSADGTTPIRLQDRPGSGNPSGSTAETSTSDNGSVPIQPPERNDSTASSNGSTPNSTTPARPQSRSPQSAEETAEGTVVFPPALIPPSLPVVVRYERGVNDQSTPSSRLVFTVRDETGESSSYSVNLSDEAGQYIEREIIRNPTARPAVTSEVTAAEEPAAPLDMEEVVVSQELIPVNSDGQVLASTEARTPVPVESPSRPSAAPLPQTPIAVEMQSAPAPIRPSVAYFPPQVVVAESSINNQPVMVSSYTVQQPAASPVYTYTYTVPQQPVMTYTYVMQQQPTVQSYRVTVPGSTTPVDATPVITLRVREQGDSQTITTTTATTETSNANTVVQPYMIMISSTETVHVVPQQVLAPPQVNVLAAFRDIPAATPGENVRDQSYTGTSDNPSTSPSAEPAAAPSNNDDDDDDDGPRAP